MSAAARDPASGAAADDAPDPRAPFRRRTVWILGGVALASLVAMFALFLFVDDPDGGPAAGSDAYSRSAIGHHGLVELLEQRGVPVIISQSDSGTRAGQGLLIVAEPFAGEAAAAQRLTTLLTSAPRVLVVLPKWWGVESSERPGWLADVALLPTDEVADVAVVLGLDRGRLGREEALARSSELSISHRPQSVSEPDEDAADAALLSHGGRAFIVELDRGDTTVTVITDPDLLNNHGLDEPGNAATVLALIDRLRQGGPVVFDEVLHGYVREPGLWALLFRYPLVLATLSALLVAVVLGLASRGRFGPPAAVPPPVAAGKDFLIAHTANLLRHGGHDAAMLRRYLVVAVHQVRSIAHAPRELAGPALVAWLERIGTARKVSEALTELEREVAAVEADRSLHRRAPAIAARIHRWREEMTLGSGNHS